MIHAIQFQHVGAPTDALSWVKIPRPKPGPGEALIRVSAANINPSDLMYVQGLYGIRPQPPCSAGFEACGVVEELGEGVSMPVGSRVIFTAIGVWQEYLCVPAKTLLLAPADLPDEVACQAFVNPFTAWGLLHEAGLQAGDTLLFTAAASALGKLVLDLCKERGIHFIGTVRQAEQVELLMSRGAHAVINTSEQSIVREVLQLTNRQGVSAVFDAVSGRTGEQALNCLANDRCMFVYGALGLEPMHVNSGLMLFKNLRIQGFWLSSWFASLGKETRREVSEAVLSRLSSHSMHTEVEAVYPFEAYKEALTHYQRPGRTGKIIFRPGA